MIIQNNTTSHSLFETNSTQKSGEKGTEFFDDLITQQKSESQIEKETTQQLMDDIRSVLHTGLTKQELEELEAKIEEIQKRIKEASKGEGTSLNHISSMMDEIEKLIQEAQKKVNGLVIKEADDNSSLTSADGLGIVSLNQRVQAALTSINALKENISSSSTPANTHDKLAQLLNQQSK